MGKTNFVFSGARKMSALFAGALFLGFVFSGCSGTKPQPSVAQYWISYDGDSYRVRSISFPDNTNSCNELISNNFVALDFDQDRFIDQIVLGDVSLSEAQSIYEYCLDRLAKEKKLKEDGPLINKFLDENTEFTYEIKSFRPASADPFNEFKIINKRALSPDVTILVDLKADGTLDEILAGSTPLDKAQAKYAEVIDSGLQKGKLTRVEKKVLVAEK